MKGFL